MNIPNSENFEDKLTPAARKALEDLVDDYRNQILLGAIKSASNLSGNVEEISVRDIYAGSNEANTPSGAEISLKQKRARQGVLIGIVYTVFSLTVGIALNLISNTFVENLDNPLTIIFLATALGGIVLSAISYYAYLRYSKSDREQSKTSNIELDFIQKWRDIEIVSRGIVSNSIGESKAEKPLSYLIREMRNSQTISLEDENLMLDLLKTRNQIVHGNARIEYKAEEIETSIMKANRLFKKLQSILEEKRGY